MRVASRGLQVAICGYESRDAGVASREMRLQVARCGLRLPNVEGLGNSLAYAYGVSMAYLCNSFALSGMSIYIFGMVLV